jgi:hypothetical protein
VPDNVTNGEDGGVTRAFGCQVEVAADPLGGGQERRGELQTRTLG